MKRLFRWAGYAVLAVLFFGAAVLGIAYYYKADILAAVNKALSQEINGEVNVGGITFSLWEETPGLSITIHDIYLRGPRYADYSKDFFSARKVYVNVRLIPLLRKEIIVRSIRITHGSIFVFRTKDGYSNTDVFKSSTAKDTAGNENPALVLFRHARLEDVRFSFQDSMKRKSIGLWFDDVRCKISQSDSSSTYALSGPMHFDGLMLNPVKGSYLKDKNTVIGWNVEVIPRSRRLILHSSVMEFDKQKVTLSGDFVLTKPGNFNLIVGSESLDYDFGISLLTQALEAKLQRIRLEKPVTVSTRVSGQLSSAAEPRVDVAFQFSDSPIQAFSIVAEAVTVTGSFSNHVDSTKENDDHNSVVRLDSLQGIFQGLPTRIKAAFHDLKDPHISLVSNIDTPLKNFASLVDTTRIQIRGGSFTSHVEFSGRLNEFLDSAKTKVEGTLKGTASVKDGVFRFVPRKHTYEKVNVSVNFDQRHVGIENISFLLNKSPITLRGELVNFVPFFILPDKKGLAKLTVYSPSLNLEALSWKEPAKKVKTPKKKASELIDDIAEKVEFDLGVQFDKVSYKKIRGSNLKGRFTLDQNSLIADKVQMNLADGEVTFSMNLTNRPVYPLTINSTIRRADIKKFFYSFNNFNQATIKDENLEGNIYMTALIRANIDADFNIQMPSLYGVVDLSLRDGKVINFEPLENMSNFLFKKRDFSNVQFGEIRSHLTIRGSEIDVRRMEIASSVLNLYIGGRYSLKGHTDLEVQVPLSNLKKRNKDYKPENVGLDKKVGPSVYLHVYNDETGKTQISYDPFKKHVKKTASKSPITKKTK